MNKPSIKKIDQPGQASSNIFRIVIFKEDDVFKNLLVQKTSKQTKKLENKADIREFLLNNIFELTDDAFEKVLTSVKHLFDEDEIKLFNAIRRIPEFNIANMEKINDAHAAGFLVYRSDYVNQYGEEAALKITPSTEDYEEERQRHVFLGTKYFEFLRNKNDQIVDFVLMLKENKLASDAIEWIVNDREQVKFFDCANSITLTYYLTLLDLLKMCQGDKIGTTVFNTLFSQPNGLRLLFNIHVLDRTKYASRDDNYTYDAEKSKTSDNPLDRPITPVAYFVDFSPLAQLAEKAPKGSENKRPIARGDFVAFQNHETYNMKHIGGNLININCLYTKSNEKGHLFSTIGMVEKTEHEIKMILCEGYNQKSQIQIDLENSDNPQHKKFAPLRPSYMEQNFNVPDQIKVEQVQGFCPSATLRFLPKKLYDLLTDHKLTYDRMCEFVENPGKIQESNNPFEFK